MAVKKGIVADVGRLFRVYSPFFRDDACFI